MKVFIKIILSLTTFLALPIQASDESDDFSLDATGGGSGESSQGASSADVLEDFDGGGSLFDETIPDVPITNSGKKMDDPQKSMSGSQTLNMPSTSKTASPDMSAVKQSPSPNSPPISVENSAGGIQTPKTDAFSSPQSTVSPSFSTQEQVKGPEINLPPDVAQPLPQAELTGDGSLAPVKQSNFVPSANEFGGVPALPGTRRDMAPGEAPEMYQVEEGDTMFDVCNQLIDDGNYWPKLWSLNPDVRNPHFIYPGMRLAFYGGDPETPPYIEVVAEDEVVPVEKGEVKEAELIVEAEEIPSTGSEGASTVTVAPPPVTSDDAAISVVSPSELGSDEDSLDGFIFSERKYQRDDVDFVVPAFVFPEEQAPLAEVISGPLGEVMAGNEKTVMIEARGEIGMGTFSILRPSGEVESLRSGDFVGYRYDFAGNVRILRKTKGGLLEGLVFDARTPVRTGDILVNFIATKRNIPSASNVGSAFVANSSVIGFDEPGRSAGGLGDLVFLEKSGLSVGSFYTIFTTERNREISHSDDSAVSEDAGSVAVVRVLEIQGESALGYIVAATGEVKLGDSLTLQ